MFAFRPPADARVLTRRTLKGITVSLERAARLVPFTVFAPPPAPAGARLTPKMGAASPQLFVALPGVIRFLEERARPGDDCTAPLWRSGVRDGTAFMVVSEQPGWAAIHWVREGTSITIAGPRTVGALVAIARTVRPLP